MSTKRTARYQKLRDTLIPWNKRLQSKDKKSNTDAYGRKGHERKRLYINACGKERTNHKCCWETKNGCPNQASKQLTPNERAETTSKPQTVAYLQA